VEKFAKLFEKEKLAKNLSGKLKKLFGRALY
jgi:hypothetical protein